jgi:hypothetical protein
VRCKGWSDSAAQVATGEEPQTGILESIPVFIGRIVGINPDNTVNARGERGFDLTFGVDVISDERVVGGEDLDVFEAIIGLRWMFVDQSELCQRCFSKEDAPGARGYLSGLVKSESHSYRGVR